MLRCQRPSVKNKSQLRCVFNHNSTMVTDLPPRDGTCTFDLELAFHSFNIHDPKINFLAPPKKPRDSPFTSRACSRVSRMMESMETRNYPTLQVRKL